MVNLSFSKEIEWQGATKDVKRHFTVKFDSVGVFY